MVSGPPPKPTALKKLQGNPGKRALNTSEPQPPAPVSVPYAPRFLTAEAKREWRRIVPLLMELGLYTEIDHAAISMYCQAYGRWLDAEREIDQDGAVRTTDKGYEHQAAWVQIANKRFDQVRRMLAEFGLTPASRSRLRIDGPEEQDELEALLFRRNVSVARE